MRLRCGFGLGFWWDGMISREGEVYVGLVVEGFGLWYLWISC